MKKTIYPVLFSVMVLFMLSCGNEKTASDTNETETLTAEIASVDAAKGIARAPMVGTLVNEKISKSSSLYKLAVALYLEQQSCTQDTTGGCSTPPNGTTTDCSTKYCGDAGCINKIICCHKIPLDTFYKLTDTGRNAHATFMSADLHKVIDQADCDNEFIKIYDTNTQSTADIVIARVTQTSPPASGWHSFYSVALMQGILKSKLPATVISMVMYRGIIFDNNNQQYNIIPFIVYYSNNTYECFDVSNDHP